MLFSVFEKFVAGRYLRSKRKDGFISVIAGFSFTGIMLGVATLIIVMSVMNGFRHELVSRILGLNGHISIQGEAIVSNFDWVKHEIKDIDGIVSVTPYVEGQVLVQTKNVSKGAVVRGLRLEDILANKLIVENLIAGSFETYSDSGIIIGYAMANRLNARIGDELTLFSSSGSSTPFGTIPKTLKAKIIGVFDVGMYEYDSNFIFMPLLTSQRFFGLKDKVSIVQVIAENSDHIGFLKHALQKQLGNSAIIHDWRRTNGGFFNALEVERNVMFLILTLIILVAAFNIISSLIMLVKDKGKEIAILRTIGASRLSIMKIFILNGASIGLSGTLAGAVLGISFALNIESIRQCLDGVTGTELFAAEIYFLSKLPAIINWSEVITVILMALFLSLVATFYPAWRASKLDPVEALRYE